MRHAVPPTDATNRQQVCHLLSFTSERMILLTVVEKAVNDLLNVGREGSSMSSLMKRGLR